MSLLKRFLYLTDVYAGDSDLDPIIQACFATIHVLSLQDKSPAKKSTQLYSHLIDRNTIAFQSRHSTRTLFHYGHLQAICTRMISHFAEDINSPFSFLTATRPHSFDRATLHVDLCELLTIIPTESWLWHLVVPLLGSALLLSTYPPGSHRM